MRSEPVKTSDWATISGGVLAVWMVLFSAPPLAGQSSYMNFFVVLEGPTWGASLPPIGVADAHCQELGYSEGFGHLAWSAYLTGNAADGEEEEVARERIGEGPWYNYYRVMIAEDLAQLHSDANNLWLESAVTVRGQTAPEESFEIPKGSQLDGGNFSRDGPFFCFGVPG